MDKILKITDNAFCSYFSMISRFGTIKQQDRIRLLILYFIYYLKYKSDYLIDITLDESDNIKLEINKERELKLNTKFKSILSCLSKNSCFIHDNNCCFDDLTTFTPPSDEDPSSKYPRALVTNANGSYPYRDLRINLGDIDRIKFYITTNDNNEYIRENDYAE